MHACLSLGIYVCVPVFNKCQDIASGSRAVFVPPVLIGLKHGCFPFRIGIWTLCFGLIKFTVCDKHGEHTRAVVLVLDSSVSIHCPRTSRPCHRHTCRPALLGGRRACVGSGGSKHASSYTAAGPETFARHTTRFFRFECLLSHGRFIRVRRGGRVFYQGLRQHADGWRRRHLFFGSGVCRGFRSCLCGLCHAFVCYLGCSGDIAFCSPVRRTGE